MTTQSNWKFCEKCNAMFFGGYAGGKCPSGGGHVAQGYTFVLSHDVAGSANAQDNWRYCQKCDALFFGGYGGGRCAAGGAHSMQGYNFVLPHDVPSTATSQDNWRFCQKCNVMFFGGYAGGKCPAGGSHASQGYNFVLYYGSEALFGAGPINPQIADIPWNRYVDQFKECIADVNYKVPPDASFYKSPILQLKYDDGAKLELDIYKDFSEMQLSADATRNALAQAYLGPSGRIFPRLMASRTVPRLWVARAGLIEAWADDDFLFNLMCMGALMSLDVPAMPAGSMEEGAIANTKATRRQLPGSPPKGYVNLNSKATPEEFGLGKWLDETAQGGGLGNVGRVRGMPEQEGASPDYAFLPKGTDVADAKAGTRADAVIATGDNIDNIISGAIGSKAGRQAEVIVIEIGSKGTSGQIKDSAVTAWKVSDVAPMSAKLQRLIVVRNNGGSRSIVLDLNIR